MQRLIILIAIICFVSCEQTEDKAMPASSNQSSAKSVDYTGWQTAKGEKVEFQYPSTWRAVIKKFPTGTQFGLMMAEDSPSVFYPIEIWEFETLGGTFEDFAAVPHQYFEKMTNKRRADLLDTKDTVFKKLPAKQYLFKKDDYQVEIITVNGGKKYFMFVYYKLDAILGIKNSVYNSVNIAY